MNAVAKRFSRAAPEYSNYAGVQKRVADRLLSRLKLDPQPTDVLEVGSGSGIFTERLLKALECPEIDLLDIASQMLKVSAELDSKRLNFIEADIVGFQSVKKYQLVLSSSALHWASSIDAAFRSINQALEEGGQFCFSIMLDRTLQELRIARRSISPSKEAPIELPSFDSVIEALEQNSFQIESSEQETFLETYGSAKEFLQSLAMLGVTGSAKKSDQLNRSELAKLTQLYQSKYQQNDDGEVIASYHLGYFTARKRSSESFG